MRNAEKQKTLPKGIRQKKNGSYIIDITNEGIRRTKTVKTYEEALQVLLEMQQNPEENTKQLTLKEAVDYCFQVLWRKGNRNCEYVANRVLEFFGNNKAVMNITQIDIANFIEHLRGLGLQDSSINLCLSKFGTILKKVADDELVPKRIKVKPVKVRSKDRNVLTEEMEKNFLDSMKKPEIREFFELLIDTGLRVGEGLNLRKEHIDFDNGFIHIYENKTDNPRTVPMSPRVIEILLSRVNNDKLFPHINYQKLLYAFNAGKKRANLPQDITIHSLRHTCLTRLAKSGANAAIIMAWAGHRELATSQRYVHLGADDLKKFAEEMQKNKAI